MKLSDHQWEFLKDVAKLIVFANQHEYKLTGGELYRPFEMQKLYFENGKSKTMESNHLQRLAIDLNIFFNGRYLNQNSDFKQIEFLGDYWESLNKKNRWGGHFSNLVDTPHFERNI